MNASLKTRQQGAALTVVLLLSALISLIVGGIVFSVTSQGTFNRHSMKYEKALWISETGIQRAMSGLKNSNDKMSWTMSMATPVPVSSGGYWMKQWIAVHDENGKEIGAYWTELMERTRSRMRLKVKGKVYDTKDSSGNELGAIERVIGVELSRFTIGNFAIASNHQMGGTHINGGARVYGGVFTSGKFNLDSSSTGIYNKYQDLGTVQNFENYPTPSDSPDAELFIYKDALSIPAPNPNGVADINNSDVGTTDAPLKGLHTQEDSTTVDPGDPSNPRTVGDGVIGNGSNTIAEPTKQDHKMPKVNFPDASANSTFMQERKTEAIANGNSFFTGNVTLGAANVSIGTGMVYDATTKNIAINGSVYIKGNLTIENEVTFTGKGSIYVEGDISASGGVEPKVKADYPAVAALGLVASNNITLDEGTGSSGRFAGFFFGNNNIEVHKCKIFGNIFGGTVNLPTTGTRPDIYVHPILMDEIGVPLPDFTQAVVYKTNWWEMSGDAKK